MAESVYYSPEAHGLKQVFETDYSDGCYQFDLRIVWLHEESGRYYTARDSGCSCPSPFESYQDLASLQHVNAQVLDELLAEIKHETAESHKYGHGYGSGPDDAARLEELRPSVAR